MKKFKQSCTDRVTKSRKLFNAQKKRVENKRNYAKRAKPIEKPSDNEWITSGKMGSRDAVLVFRTNILTTSSNKCISGNTSSTSIIESSGLSSYSESKSIDFDTTTLCSSANTQPPYKTIFSGLICEQCEEFELETESDSFLDMTQSSSAFNNMNSNFDEDFIHESVNSLNIDDLRHYSVEEDGSYSGDEYEDHPFSQTMPAVDLKITFKFIQTETKLLRKIFLRHGLTEIKDDDENVSILWTGVQMKPDVLRNLTPYQRVNHFPRSYELTRKDRLYKNIERMQHLRGVKRFDIVPQSFLLPLEYKDLVSAHNKHRGPWIVKPTASSRGRGIFIVNAPDQIPQDEQVLVSKYILDPLCIDGHKCDLRVYVLVTSFDPLIIYLYEEGLVRLATVKYDRKTDNLWNPCMHLCNYSINKYHSDYIKSIDAQHEDVGHKWTLSALLRHLKSQGCDTSFLMFSIEDLIIKSIFSCAQSVISACRMFVPNGNNCFELFGYDILIDDTLKPWLLEINLSPSMGVDSPLDTKVKACLIADLLTCVGIPAISTNLHSEFDTKWSRFHNLNCGRKPDSTSGQRRFFENLSSIQVLTLEEQRIIRNARLQNARRGGFVRIFPTDDTMQRYSNYMDSASGIPLSTPPSQGQVTYPMVLSHNYNQILFTNLYGKNSRDYGQNEENSPEYRMFQYERPLQTEFTLIFHKRKTEEKCSEKGTQFRKQILKLIETGSELTQLQARQTFSSYLDAVLRRLIEEPRDNHEKLILRFLNRVGGGVKASVLFRNQQYARFCNKARTAMIAKLLGDFLEQYRRDTEAYVDSFDHFGMIPSKLFNDFISQAQETDLEYVLTLHTNLTGVMPYLYNRYGLLVPSTPPIPSGTYGFLKALPAMVVNGSGARDFNKFDGYYKNSELALSKK